MCGLEQMDDGARQHLCGAEQLEKYRFLNRNCTSPFALGLGCFLHSDSILLVITTIVKTTFVSRWTLHFSASSALKIKRIEYREATRLSSAIACVAPPFPAVSRSLGRSHP